MGAIGWVRVRFSHGCCEYPASRSSESRIWFGHGSCPQQGSMGGPKKVVFAAFQLIFSVDPFLAWLLWTSLSRDFMKRRHWTNVKAIPIAFLCHELYTGVPGKKGIDRKKIWGKKRENHFLRGAPEPLLGTGSMIISIRETWFREGSGSR